LCGYADLELVHQEGFEPLHFVFELFEIGLQCERLRLVADGVGVKERDLLGRLLDEVTAAAHQRGEDSGHGQFG